MATIIQCDGCDKFEKLKGSHQSFRHFEMALTPSGRENPEIKEQYDLCESCYSEYKRRIDPRQWVRHVLGDKLDG